MLHTLWRLLTLPEGAREVRTEAKRRTRGACWGGGAENAVFFVVDYTLFGLYGSDIDWPSDSCPLSPPRLIWRRYLRWTPTAPHRL
jgi:hypothetical protein